VSGSAQQRLPLEIAGAGRVEVIVGIPSFGNARTIAHVVSTAIRGLSSYFPGSRTLVFNSDGGSTDGTPDVLRQAAAATLAELHPGEMRPHVASSRYRGISGKGSAFREIFEVAHGLGASAVVLLDADLRSVAPDWIARLALPIVEGRVDYVAPLYRRHKFDGTITNSIVFPLTDALFGGSVRQPIGGDFGVCGELAEFYAGQDVWNGDVARFGIDLWMTIHALAGGWRVGQMHLGAKIHDPKDPGQHLAKMLVEVVGTAFSLIEEHETRWLSGTRAHDAEIFGEPRPVELPAVEVNVERMLEQFRFGVQSLEPVYGSLFDARLRAEIDCAARIGDFPDEIWVETILQYIVAFHEHRLPREQLLASLTPLYLGRTGCFVARNREATEDEAEERVQGLARAFRGRVPELIARWGSGEKERQP
jgi:hypothetical protein